jgi:prevent-host-death family protein
MHDVNVYEAKTRLSALLRAVARGEEVVISHRNRPVARLVPVAAPRRRPVFGSARAALLKSGLRGADLRRALEPMRKTDLAEWGVD